MEENKTCIIVEKLNSTTNLKVERGADGLMRLSGVFGVTDIINNNQRIYNKDNYKKMVESLQEKIAAGELWGECEHPNTLNLNMDRASHKIESLSFDETKGEAYGTIVLLNTHPHGYNAQAMVEAGIPLFVSSRASGVVDKDRKVTLEKLVTFDLVGSAGFSQAKLKPNQTFESINENISIITNNNQNEEKNQNNMEKTIEELKEQINKLEEKINTSVKDRELLLEAIEKWFVGEMIPDIQKWVSEDYSNSLETWLTTEFMPNNQSPVNNDQDIKNLSEGIEKWIIEEYTPNIQKWIVEEYSQQIQGWVVEEYSQEIQNWMVEHYSEGIQNWMVEHYSEGVQNWVTRDFSEKLETWMTEEFTPEIKTWIVEEAQNNKTLNLNAKLKELSEQWKQDKEVLTEGQRLLQNAKFENPYIDLPLIVSMPSQYKDLWENASDEVKSNIINRSKLYNLITEDAVNKFWAHQSFEPITETKKDKNVRIQESQEDFRKRFHDQVQKLKKS